MDDAPRTTLDITDRLRDLHKQATQERSHHYTGACIRDALAEIKRLRAIAVALANADDDAVLSGVRMVFGVNGYPDGHKYVLDAVHAALGREDA